MSSRRRRVLVAKIRHFRALPDGTKYWLVPAWLLLGLGRAAIVVIPVRYLAYSLGARCGPYPWVPLIDVKQQQRANTIARALVVASRYTPWQSNCFPQAIAASILLRSSGLPYTLFLGVARGDSETRYVAHAWVTSGRVCVAGGRSFGRFTVVETFASHQLVAP